MFGNNFNCIDTRSGCFAAAPVARPHTAPTWNGVYHDFTGGASAQRDISGYKRGPINSSFSSCATGGFVAGAVAGLARGG